MNRRQQHALNHPATSILDIKHGGYNLDTKLSSLRLSTILVIESTGGETSWHASAAVLSGSGNMKPAASVFAADKTKIRNYLIGLLLDVGTGEFRLHDSETVFHVFRDLTAEELGKIGKAKSGH